MSDKTHTIRDLNDVFRRNPQRHGRLVLTAGVLAEGTEFVDKCLQTVRSFDAFDDDNDPWREHDFGAFKVEEKRCFFKIDYYNRDMRYHSPDPTDAADTLRVMAIMLAEEY
jgi:hypothetical protein